MTNASLKLIDKDQRRLSVQFSVWYGEGLGISIDTEGVDEWGNTVFNNTFVEISEEDATVLRDFLNRVYS